MGMIDRIGPKKPTRLFIREWMEKVPIDNERLAERMDCSPGTVSKLLNGHMKMTTEWLAAFADALNVEVPQLFHDPNRPTMDELLRKVPPDEERRILVVVDAMVKEALSKRTGTNG